VALLIAFTSASGVADSGSAHQAKQSPPIQLGTSGGNVNDKTKAFCCSGTLGALVTKGTTGTQYILSNNHVLGRLSQAVQGEDVSQPGLIDNGCKVFQAVADFSEAPPLGGSKNVDAAIAEARKNSATGEYLVSSSILDIGTISSTSFTPAPGSSIVGQTVMKSGRTTGFTRGAISTIADVNVQYQSGCGSGKKFTVLYKNQIVVSGSGFSAGGDSGSLIVSDSNDTSSCKRPVGLLFAGSSTTTIANPIADVINAFDQLSFVGGPVTDCTAPLTTLTTTTTSTANFGPSQAAIDHAQNVKDQHRANFLSMPNVLGMGVGVADDNPSEAVVVIYVETGRAPLQALPDTLDGLQVKVVTTEPFVAYGNQAWGDNSCSGK
jgi:hypothetical protein